MLDQRSPLRVHVRRWCSAALALAAARRGRGDSGECKRKVDQLRASLVAFDRAVTLLDDRYPEIALPVAAAPASGSRTPGGLIALRGGRLSLDGRDLGEMSAAQTAANLDQDLAIGPMT